MNRAASLYDLSDDDLTQAARRASANAVRKLRAAGLTATGIEPAARISRKVTGSQPSTTSPRRVKATVRGA